MGQVHSEINGFAHSNNLLGKHNKPSLEPIGDWHSVKIEYSLEKRGYKFLGICNFQ